MPWARLERHPLSSDQEMNSLGLEEIGQMKGLCYINDYVVGIPQS